MYILAYLKKDSLNRNNNFSYIDLPCKTQLCLYLFSKNNESRLPSCLKYFIMAIMILS